MDLYDPANDESRRLNSAPWQWRQGLIAFAGTTGLGVAVGLTAALGDLANPGEDHADRIERRTHVDGESVEIDYRGMEIYERTFDPSAEGLQRSYLNVRYLWDKQLKIDVLHEPGERFSHLQVSIGDFAPELCDYDGTVWTMRMDNDTTHNTTPHWRGLLMEHPDGARLFEDANFDSVIELTDADELPLIPALEEIRSRDE